MYHLQGSSYIEPNAISSHIRPFPHIGNEQSRLRRTTCDLCRERKVRCDRGKPECGRCKRVGQECVYPSTFGESNDLNSVLRSFHSRLMQTEANIIAQAQVIPNGHSRPNSEPRKTFQSQGASSSVDMDMGCLASGGPESWDNLLPASSVTSLGTEGDMLKDAFIPNGDFWVPDSSAMSSTSSQLPPIEGIEASVDDPMISQNDDSWLIGEDGLLSAIVIQDLFNAHFDVVQKHLPLIDREKFEQSSNRLHQELALRYAVAMSGAGTSTMPSQQGEQCYLAARSYLEKAEMQMNGASPWNIETVQALILVARFEFINKSPARALLTTGRLIRLVTLLGFDQLDQSDVSRDCPEHFRTLALPPEGLERLDEVRHTFWITYAINCHAMANVGRSMPLEMNEITTTLPYLSDDVERPETFTLQHGVSAPLSNDAPALVLLVLAMRLVSQTTQHHRLTSANVAKSSPAAAEYNFCLEHERLENMMGNILSSSTSIEGCAATEMELRTLALVITYGARIALYEAAIVNSRKARFLAPVAEESRKISSAAATSISDLLLQADALNPSQVAVYREMNLFILPSLALAAEIQLGVLKRSVQGLGFNAQSRIHGSLESLCSALETFQGPTAEHKACIQECRAYLGSNRTDGWFNSAECIV